MEELKSLSLKFEYSISNIVFLENDKLAYSNGKEIAEGFSVNFSN